MAVRTTCVCVCTDRNYNRGTNSSGQLYGRSRGGRGRGLGDEIQAVWRGTRTVSQSQQLPKLPSQSTDQNLSDVGNEEWETASESSDVLAHHHTHDAKPDDSKSTASRESKRDPKKSITSYHADRSQRDNTSEPRSGAHYADGRNGQRSSSSGNGGINQRGTRDTGSSRSSAVTLSDAANRLAFSPLVGFFSLPCELKVLRHWP